jgi:hypothetical protein
MLTAPRALDLATADSAAEHDDQTSVWFATREQAEAAGHQTGIEPPCSA